MRPRSARQLGRREAEDIAAGPLDMNDLGAEFGELRTDIGLRAEAAGADDTNPFERPERGRDARRRRAFQPLDPVRDLLFQLFDLVVGNEPRVVRHCACSPCEGASAGWSGCFCCNKCFLWIGKASHSLGIRSRRSQPVSSHATTNGEPFYPVCCICRESAVNFHGLVVRACAISRVSAVFATWRSTTNLQQKICCFLPAKMCCYPMLSCHQSSLQEATKPMW